LSVVLRTLASHEIEMGVTVAPFAGSPTPVRRALSYINCGMDNPSSVWFLRSLEESGPTSSCEAYLASLSPGIAAIGLLDRWVFLC